MDIGLLFQIAAVGIIVAVLNQILIKSEHTEQALMVTLAGLVIVLIMVVGEINELFILMKSIFGV